MVRHVGSTVAPNPHPPPFQRRIMSKQIFADADLTADDLKLWRRLGKPRVMPNVLLKAAKHPYWEIRQDAVFHPACPAAALAILVRDIDWVITSNALKHPQINRRFLTEFARSPTPEFRYSVARNPRCALHLLARLARDPEPEVRAAVAANRRTPQATLRFLAADRSRRVRTALKGRNK